MEKVPHVHPSGIENEYDELHKRLQRLRDSMVIQCSDGSYNYSPYMFGMAYGLILAVATMEDETPVYPDPPVTWLEDEPLDAE